MRKDTAPKILEASNMFLKNVEQFVFAPEKSLSVKKSNGDPLGLQNDFSSIFFQKVKKVLFDQTDFFCTVSKKPKTFSSGIEKLSSVLHDQNTTKDVTFKTRKTVFFDRKQQKTKKNA